MFAHRFSPRGPSNPSIPSSPSSTTSSSSLAPVTSAAAPHLALFQSLSDHIRSNPEFVIEQITEWLCAPDSPRTWSILALCLRATAHESVDAIRAAQDDYGRVLLLWDDLINDLGSEKIRRWKVNMQFAQSRFMTLGGDTDGMFRSCTSVTMRLILSSALLKSHKRRTGISLFPGYYSLALTHRRDLLQHLLSWFLLGKNSQTPSEPEPCSRQVN